MDSEKKEMLTNGYANGHLENGKTVTADHTGLKKPFQMSIASEEFNGTITSRPIKGDGTWEGVSQFYKKSIVIGCIGFVCGVAVLIIDGIYMAGDPNDRKQDTSIVFGESLLCFLAAVFTIVAGRFSRMALHVTCMVFSIICALGSATVVLLIASTDIPRELGEAWNHVGQYETNEAGFIAFLKKPENEFQAIKHLHASLFIARCVFLCINTVICIVQAAFCCRLTCCRPKIQVKIVYADNNSPNHKLLP